MTSRAFHFLFLLLATTSATVRAADQPAVPTLPPPPTIEGQIELPKQSPMDRQKSTAQVKAMQLMQSQKSGMMCQMMRQMAMQEPNPTNKMMMMMMAQKSCDDSDAAKKAAEDNDKNRKLISQEDVPKMQKLKASSLPLDFGQQKGSDESQNLDAFKVKLDENYTKTDGSIPTTDSTALVNALTAGADGSGSQVVSAKDLQDAARDASGGGGPGAPSMSSLPAIAGDGKGGLAGDGTKGLSPAGGGGMMGLGGMGGAGGAGSAAGAGSTAAAGSGAGTGDATATADRKKSREADGGAGAGGGGGSETPAKSGNDPFEALLAQMLGGPPAASEENGFNAGETVSMEKASKNLQTTNLFEYASLRYRRLATTQRVVAQSRSRKEATKSDPGKPLAEAAPKAIAAAAPSAPKHDEAARQPASDPSAAVTEARRAAIR